MSRLLSFVGMTRKLLLCWVLALPGGAWAQPSTAPALPPAADVEWRREVHELRMQLAACKAENERLKGELSKLKAAKSQAAGTAASQPAPVEGDPFKADGPGTYEIAWQDHGERRYVQFAAVDRQAAIVIALKRKLPLSRNVLPDGSETVINLKKINNAPVEGAN